MAHLKQDNWGGCPPIDSGGRRAHERVRVHARHLSARARCFDGAEVWCQNINGGQCLVWSEPALIARLWSGQVLKGTAKAIVAR